MAYVPPVYPAAIPTITDLPDRTDDVDWLYAARYNELKKELRAALTELGALPKGSYADVKTRLNEGGPSSKCRAYRITSSQSITQNTWVKVQLNAENFDGLNEFDPVTNYRFTAQKAGYYVVNCVVTLESMSDGELMQVAFYKNGTAHTKALSAFGLTTSWKFACGDLIQLAANDYVELYVKHNHGSARNLLPSIESNFMSIHKLS